MLGRNALWLDRESALQGVCSQKASRMRGHVALQQVRAQNLCSFGEGACLQKASRMRGHVALQHVRAQNLCPFGEGFISRKKIKMIHGDN
jgi:hypothetical protein